MQKKGEVQKSFIFIIILILALAVFVSYIGNEKTGRAVIKSDNEDTKKEPDDSYRGLCGQCASVVCIGSPPGSPCVITDYGTGKCVSNGECDSGHPSKGVKCNCEQERKPLR